jgi:hypothetical protein
MPAIMPMPFSFRFCFLPALRGSVVKSYYLLTRQRIGHRDVGVWNPDEKVWNHLKHEELKGHQAKTKAEIKQLAEDKLTNMSQNPQLLRGIYFRCCVADLLS